MSSRFGPGDGLSLDTRATGPTDADDYFLGCPVHWVLHLNLVCFGLPGYWAWSGGGVHLLRRLLGDAGGVLWRHQTYGFGYFGEGLSRRGVGTTGRFFYNPRCQQRERPPRFNNVYNTNRGQQCNG